MGDFVSSKRHNRWNTKYVYDKGFRPTKPSAEARICLGCSNKNCKGNCKRYKEEHKKLKERKNES